MNVLIATSLDFYSCVRPGLCLPQWLEVQVELHVGELLQHRKREQLPCCWRSFRAQPPVCITFGSMYHPSTGHEIVLISLPPFSLQFTAPGFAALSMVCCLCTLLWRILAFSSLASVHWDHELPQEPEHLLSQGTSEDTVPAPNALCAKKSEKVE